MNSCRWWRARGSGGIKGGPKAAAAAAQQRMKKRTRAAADSTSSPPATTRLRGTVHHEGHVRPSGLEVVESLEKRLRGGNNRASSGARIHAAPLTALPPLTRCSPVVSAEWESRAAPRAVSLLSFGMLRIIIEDAIVRGGHAATAAASAPASASPPPPPAPPLPRRFLLGMRAWSRSFASRSPTTWLRSPGTCTGMRL